jgi:hypothetical protein
MARPWTLSACSVLALAAAAPVYGACRFENNEIANPFEPGCGDAILTYTESDNAGHNVALGYPVPIPVDSLTPVDGFRTYDSLFQRHQALLTDHDEVDGRVVGNTIAGRQIWAYRIGDENTTTAEGFTEGAVLVNGGIHAREWQTPEAVTGLMEALIEGNADLGLGGKADGGLDQYLVENLTTVLVPVNNVDGFLQTQRFPDRATADREEPRDGRMRRKNMRNPETQGAVDEDITTVFDNFWGIDLNRNSSAGFGQNNGSRSSLTSLIYRGETPESEPELIALQEAATLGPAARLRLYSDTHSFGQIYLAPTTGNTRRNTITAQLADRMARASLRPGYGFGPDPPGSTGIGTTADHFAFAHQVPSWTLELEPANGGQDYGGVATHGHSGFVLPDREVARMRVDVARMYLLGFYRQAGPPAAIAAQIRDRDSGEIVYDAAWQPVSATARERATATNQALVPGRNYRLWVAFNKPMRVRDAGGTVVPYRGQSSGAAVGAVTLEFPDLDGQEFSLPDSGDAWLDVPGGAPDGYLRYRDDAIALDFTLPADLPVTVPTAAVLVLSVSDLAQMALDADPATAADWASGHWVRLEDPTGSENDIGGIACSFTPFVAPDEGASPPTADAVCAAAQQPPPPPPPPPDDGGGGGGGGGALDPALAGAVALLLLQLRGAARSAPRRARLARSEAPR